MNRRSLLLIEDDTGIQAITKFSLEMDSHWQVTVAGHGKEGLLIAKAIHPDVILLDLIMPDMEGIEIIKRLNSHYTTKNIPIILFTAKLFEGSKQEFSTGNVIGKITKPFDSLTLSTKISHILKQNS